MATSRSSLFLLTLLLTGGIGCAFPCPRSGLSKIQLPFPTSFTPITLSPNLLKDRQSDTDRDSSIKVGGSTVQFVPAFVAVWAVGYSAVAWLETSGGGLGDTGGFVGVGLVAVLMFALVGAAAYEVFKEQ
jgi:hypothetical protein